MVVAAVIALRATIGTSTVEPQSLVACGSNTPKERCIIVVRASGTVLGDLNTSDLDE